MDVFITAAPSLRPRDEAATSTSSSLYLTVANGCVACPPTSGSCPQCPTGQECVLTSRTCYECPVYKCQDIPSSNSGPSAPIGGIVGGVVGGMAVLVAALVAYYLLVYRKKHPRLNEDSDGYDSKYEMESQVGTGSGSGVADESFSSQGEKAVLPRVRPPGALGANKNRRLSSYESFMRPPRNGKRGPGNSRARGGVNGANNASRGVRPGMARGGSSDTSFSGGDTALSKRHSVATTMSTTNASNILPIAYIPGVTIRPTKNNTRSIFLYDADSVFSDFTGLDNALIVQERADSHAKNTMTAVKVQPRLVNVARIDEDIAEEDEDEEDVSVNETLFWSGNSEQPHNKSTLDGESDSDVDSDIGEINRATSTRRAPPVRNVFGDAAAHDHGGYESPDETIAHELHLDEDDYDDKSFVLDIARET